MSGIVGIFSKKKYKNVAAMNTNHSKYGTIKYSTNGILLSITECMT